MDFSRIVDSIPDSQPDATIDPFEQYLDLSFATSLTPVINPPTFDFDQWYQSQPTAYVPFYDTLNKTTEGVRLLFQDKPCLSAVFSNLTLTDSYDMTMPLSLPQGLPPASTDSQTLQLPSTSQLLPASSLSSYSIYEDALGLTWPTSDVTFEDFDMQDLSFLEVAFIPTTAVAMTSAATAPLLDFQSQPTLLLLGNSDSHTANNGNNNVMDGLSYSIAPPSATTVTTTATSITPANMLSYPNPCPQASPLPQAVSAPPSSDNSVNPFRTMANTSNLFLPLMDTLPTVPHISETAPGALPLLWSTFPSVQPVLPPSESPLLHPDPAMILPPVVPQSTPVQDAIICQSYSPTAFVLDGSIIAKKLASTRQSASITLSRRTSAPIGSSNAVPRSSPYARPRYPQEPKERRTSGLSDGDDEYGIEGGNDAKGGEVLKLKKAAETNGATTLFDALQRQHVESFSTPLSSPLPPTKTSAATPTAQNGHKGKSNQKSGCKPTLKRITDCAHYRPRNAFFMFRGFVSHIHTHLHAKQLSASSSSKGSSAFSFPSSSSCPMTPIASKTTLAATRLDPDKNHRNSSVKSDNDNSIVTPSPPKFDFPMRYSDIQLRQQRPHMSLHLPPTTCMQSQTTTTLTPHPSRRRTRQAQTKVSVSCGKIWSSPCLPTCSPRSTGCANCRMRSLFRQASDYLKLRQTEIERLIEFPLLSHGDHGSSEGEGDGGKGRMLRLEDSFNWREFELLYPESDLFKWHREYYTNHGNDVGDSEGVVLDVEEMKVIWMENELAYEKAFSEGARKRITQEGLKATTGVGYSSFSNKRTVSAITHQE